MFARSLGWLLLISTTAAVGLKEAHAVVLYHEQFTHPDASLLKVPGPGNPGLTPVPGPGNPWSSAGGDLTPIQVLNGQAVLIQTAGGANGQDALAPLGPQPASAITYARFDFRLPSDSNTLNQDVIEDGAFFVALRTSAASGLRARTGLVAPAAAGDFRLAISVDTSDLVADGVAWNGDLDFDITYRAVIAYNAADGSSKLWLNPTDESSPSITDTSASSGSVIENFYLRQADDYAGKQFIDNLVVATTFAEALSGGVANFLEADFNTDGDVDGEDLAQWRLSFGVDAMGDADGDDDTDGEDFLIWQRQLGQTPPPANGATAAIPEPGSLVLAAAAFGLLLARRRIAANGSRN